MRSLLLVVFCCFIPDFTQAQFRHYISVNPNLYANFFNKEKEPFGPIPFTEPLAIIPELSYKIEKGKNGLEIHFSTFYRKYQDIEYGKTKAGDLIEIARYFVGVNYHRRVLQSRYFSISSFAGLTYGSYFATTLIVWNRHPLWTEAIFGGSGDEMYLGLQFGANVNVPIWNGLYFNGNLRYGAVPWAKQDYFRHHMVVNLGLGYKF